MSDRLRQLIAEDGLATEERQAEALALIDTLTTRLAEVTRHANEDREAWFEKCAKLEARLAALQSERHRATRIDANTVEEEHVHTIEELRAAQPERNQDDRDVR